MPLGLLPGMSYEEKEATIAPGEALLLYSDGVTEAHRPQPRDVRHARGSRSSSPARRELIERRARRACERFTGDGLGAGGRHHARHAPARRRAAAPAATTRAPRSRSRSRAAPATSARRCERVARRRRRRSASTPRRLEQLKTAVAEAAMNAIEHGNEGREELPVEVEVEAADGDARRPHHRRGARRRRSARRRRPDLEAKLAGLQKPRGWGLFLIENMVDEIRVSDADGPAHGRARREPGRRWHGCRPLSWRHACATRASTAVIELAGDIDRDAEARSRRGVLAGRAAPDRGARLRRCLVHQLDRHRA